MTMTRKAQSKKPASKQQGRLDPNNPKQITLALRERFKTRAPVAYDRGRERMGQHLEKELDCTPTRARHIVSSLVDRGFLRYSPHPDFQHDHTVGRWTYHPTAQD